MVRNLLGKAFFSQFERCDLQPLRAPTAQLMSWIFVERVKLGVHRGKGLARGGNDHSIDLEAQQL